MDSSNNPSSGNVSVRTLFSSKNSDSSDQEVNITTEDTTSQNDKSVNEICDNIMDFEKSSIIGHSSEEKIKEHNDSQNNPSSEKKLVDIINEFKMLSNDEELLKETPNTSNDNNHNVKMYEIHSSLTKLINSIKDLEKSSFSTIDNTSEEKLNLSNEKINLQLYSYHSPVMKCSDVTCSKESEQLSSINIQIEEKRRKNPKQNFKPKIYAFRAPPDMKYSDITKGFEKCIPFNLLLDHTLAIIWCIICHKKFLKSLDIIQLQSALNFLMDIRNKNGKHTKDVALCITMIEDLLISKYASTDQHEEKGDARELIKPKNNASVSTNNTCKTYDNNSVLSSYVSNKSKNGSTMNNVRKAQFSVNYTELRKMNVHELYKPRHLISESDFSDNRYTENDAMSSKNEAMSEYSQVKTFSEVSLRYPHSNVMNFLRLWRTDQIEKIQMELKRLHNIEEYIHNVNNKQEFKPYIDEEVAAKLEDLIVHKT